MILLVKINTLLTFSYFYMVLKSLPLLSVFDDKVFFEAADEAFSLLVLELLLILPLKRAKGVNDDTSNNINKDFHQNKLMKIVIEKSAIANAISIVGIIHVSANRTCFFERVVEVCYRAGKE